MNQSPLSMVGTIKLDLVPGKKTKDCFPDCVYRNADIDRCLPAEQLPADASVITEFVPKEGTTFVDWASEILSISPNTSIEWLSRLLKEHGHIMTLVQAEKIIEQQEEQKTSFFFVGDNDDDVSVVVVSKNGYTNIFQFGICGSWGGDSNRVFVRNFKIQEE